MDIDELLRTQDGLVSHDQAGEIGIDRHAIHRLVRSGAWIVVRPRVYRAAHHSSSPRSDLRSAALWAGDGATMIGLAAASWWDLTDRVPGPAAFAVGPGGNHTTPPGIVAVRRPVGVLDREQVDGVWVLRRSFAALEAAVELGLVDGARLLDRALQQKRIGIAALGDAREAFGQRHGAVLARRLVALAEGGARSEAERDAIRQLRRAGITGWVPNLPVQLPGFGTAILDLAFREHRLAIEIDGWAHHRDVDRFRRDGLRQNEVVISGWRVIRVTWYELHEDPGYLPGIVGRALALGPAA
jgi:very-short-patch-repair endonuclease